MKGCRTFTFIEMLLFLATSLCGCFKSNEMQTDQGMTEELTCLLLSWVLGVDS